MTLHKLLIRQLHKLGLNDYSDLPDNKKWQELVDRISKTYEGMDQECYLLERSMKISSQEMKQLNQRLEAAQHIARLGHWHYCKNDKKIIWSKELYNVFGFKSGETIPSYEQFLKMIHEDERSQLESLMEHAFTEGKEYEYEIRVLIPDKTYHWFYIIGHPSIENNCLDGIAMDITKRKQAELEITLLHKQLLSSARRAGMSEVATSILHNVGNILNSANVSTTLLKETISQSHYKKLFHLVNMMREHNSSLEEYLFNDAKGKLILEYLFEISDILADNHRCLEAELDSLDNNLKHIKDIVAIQQTISGVSGVMEKVVLSEIIDAALHMSDVLIQDKNIKIEKNYENIPAILTDKSKLLQILVNLIKNAADAVMSNKDIPNKEIRIQLKKYDSQNIILSTIDNGIGISPENGDKIFSFGFTTKEHGHGFGLHASALAAKEMGGNLQVESQGFGMGATFNLILPLKSQQGIAYD